MWSIDAYLEELRGKIGEAVKRAIPKSKVVWLNLSATRYRQGGALWVIGNYRLLGSLYRENSSTHGRGAERLDRRATAVRALAAYPGKPLQTGGSRTDAGNGTLEPVAVSIDPQYGTVGPFRSPGATGTRWSALLDCECGTVPCVAGPEGKRHA